tara:strand:- start:740 stop:1456 length:717 start_codon:yes stop_codon:yes gene_type:complete
MTEKLYLRDATLKSFEGVVTDVDDSRIELNQTAFYATSGGQPHDTGYLTWDNGAASVIDVRTVDGRVWHTLAGLVPKKGTAVLGEIDYERRQEMMRTHTAMHILCGVIWKKWKRVVTGGNMDALCGRMDFEIDEIPKNFASEVEELCNEEIVANRSILISFIHREKAVLDRDLIRTKTNLVPDSIEEIRIVDIAGLDRQADGGTHVSSTGQVGRIKIVKTESKGRGFKRVRFVVVDKD